ELVEVVDVAVRGRRRALIDQQARRVAGFDGSLRDGRFGELVVVVGHPHGGPPYDARPWPSRPARTPSSSQTAASTPTWCCPSRGGAPASCSCRRSSGWVPTSAPSPSAWPRWATWWWLLTCSGGWSRASWPKERRPSPTAWSSPARSTGT